MHELRLMFSIRYLFSAADLLVHDRQSEFCRVRYVCRDCDTRFTEGSDLISRPRKSS